MSQCHNLSLSPSQQVRCQGVSNNRSGEPLHSVCTDSDSDNTDLLSEAGLAKSQSIEIQYLTRENDADTSPTLSTFARKIKEKG